MSRAVWIAAVVLHVSVAAWVLSTYRPRPIKVDCAAMELSVSGQMWCKRRSKT